MTDWDFPEPHLVSVTVSSADIDIMGHTNNVVYLRWLEQLAWSHSNHLGLDWACYQQHDRAMVARRHELDYLGATFAGDELLLATWIIENDQRLSIRRAYQIIRQRDGATVLRGCTHWVCVEISSGKPKRMPENFVQGYAVTAHRHDRCVV